MSTSVKSGCTKLNFNLLNSKQTRVFAQQSDKYNNIIENLFLGKCPVNEEDLPENTKHVLTIMETVPKLIQTMKDDGKISHKHVYATDNAKTILDEILFEETNNFINNALEKGEVVYVHCAAGVSRSASLVIAFLMWKQKKDFSTVYDFVKKLRKCISPNIHFCGCLLLYEQFLNKDPVIK